MKKGFILSAKRAGKPPKTVRNCFVEKGKIGRYFEVGVGEPKTIGGIDGHTGEGWTEEVYDRHETKRQPLFNRDLIQELGLKDKDTVGLTFGEAVADERISQAMLVMGENKGGLLCEDYEELKRREVEEKKEVLFNPHNCWETGLNWYQLVTRVPKEVFSAMGLRYHSEQEEEEGEWRGWYTMDYKEVSGKLEAIGWKAVGG